MNDSNGRVVIYTDGACSGNPGPGGWGAILRWNGTEKEMKGGEPETTNNRMELMAAIQALETLKRGVEADLYTDSTYVQKGITEWIHSWKKRGWKTAAKKPVKRRQMALGKRPCRPPGKRACRRTGADGAGRSPLTRFISSKNREDNNNARKINRHPCYRWQRLL